MKTVALFGGSFDPPHPGHFETGKYIHEKLGVDEVWFLFSKNWQKDPAKYATPEDRMEMGRILASKYYPDKPFVMTNIEEEIGTHITYDVLTALKARFTDTRFIWVMGADNLATFHTWEHYEEIIRNHPIAVVDRPPYTQKALQSPTALKFAFLKAASPRVLSVRDNGWCFMDNPKLEMSSSKLLEEMRQGRTVFDGPFQDIADYILRHRLYGIGAAPAAAGQKPVP